MINEIIENFSLLEDWEERYAYLIELGGMLTPYPDEMRDESHKVRGCVSQVWLTCQTSRESSIILTFRADSDAHIVRGLLYILLALYNGKDPDAILTLNPHAIFKQLELNEHLTPQRSNGVRAVIERIRHIANNMRDP